MTQAQDDQEPREDEGGLVERRSDARVKISTAVTLKSTTNFITMGENVSVSGIYVVVADDLPVGSLVDVEFSIVGLEREFSVAGEVRWKEAIEKEGNPGWGLGVEFLSLTDEERGELKEFVDQRQPLSPTDAGD